jgi:hypothetical protein
MQSRRFLLDAVVALDAPMAAAKDERKMRLTREGGLGELWRKAGLVWRFAQCNVPEQAQICLGARA